jgi:hypothetical protein
MDRTYSNSKLFKVITLMLAFLVTISTITFTSSSLAFAEGIGVDDGAVTGMPGETFNPPPGVIPQPGTVVVPSPGSGNGFAKKWITTWGYSGKCGSSAYGASIGVKDEWVNEHATSDMYADPANAWPPGAGWVKGSSTGLGGYWFFRTIPTGSYECIWPPSYALVTAECIISTTANIREVRPNNILIDSRTVYSGYSFGSSDREACADSKTRISLNANITRYSIVEAFAVSSAAKVTFKVYTSADPRTGSKPATEFIGALGPYNLTPKTDSLSISCRNVSRPADYSLTDFTDNLCNPSTFNPSYQCNASPVLFDSSPAGSATPTMNSFPGNSIQYVKQQTANSGKQIVFNQNPSGAGITVNSYKTQFTRSADSTPWKASLGNSNNLVELDAVSPTGSLSKNILTDGTSSPWYSTKTNTTKFIAYDASDNGKPTRISQILEWIGTRSVTSATITGMNPLTGALETAATTINVPTSGMCTQTAAIDMVRTIGDKVN